MAEGHVVRNGWCKLVCTFVLRLLGIVWGVWRAWAVAVGRVWWRSLLQGCRFVVLKKRCV